jgi:hypothetical protein
MPTQLAADLLSFTEAVGHLDMPEAVLDALDAITWRLCHAHVLGAALLPLNFGTADSLVVGKTVCTRAYPKGGGRIGPIWQHGHRRQVMSRPVWRSRPSPSQN